MIISRKSNATSRQLGSVCCPMVLTPIGAASRAINPTVRRQFSSSKTSAHPQESLVRSAVTAIVGLSLTLCIWYNVYQSPIPTALDVVHPALTMVAKSVPLSATVVSERPTRVRLLGDGLQIRETGTTLAVAFSGPNARWLKAGQTVFLRSADFGGPVSGILQRVAGSKNFAITQIQLIDHSNMRINSGTDCGANVLITGYTAQLTIPESAVTTVDGNPTVFVVHKGKLESRTLVIGLSDQNVVPVYAGVHPSDTVVVNPAGASVGDSVIPHVVVAPA